MLKQRYTLSASVYLCWTCYECFDFYLLASLNHVLKHFIIVLLYFSLSFTLVFNSIITFTIFFCDFYIFCFHFSYIVFSYFANFLLAITSFYSSFQAPLVIFFSHFSILASNIKVISHTFISFFNSSDI